MRANQDVELLLSIANLVPDSRIIEGRAVDFLHFQNVGVEPSRTFQVVNGDENMMEANFAHGRPMDERSKRQTVCYKAKFSPELYKRAESFSTFVGSTNSTIFLERSEFGKTPLTVALPPEPGGTDFTDCADAISACGPPVDQFFILRLP